MDSLDDENGANSNLTTFFDTSVSNVAAIPGAFSNNRYATGTGFELFNAGLGASDELKFASAMTGWVRFRLSSTSNNSNLLNSTV